MFLDERAQAVNLVLTLPLDYLMANIYPRLYALHALSEKVTKDLKRKCYEAKYYGNTHIHIVFLVVVSEVNRYIHS